MTRSKLRRCSRGCRTLTPNGEPCAACADRRKRAARLRETATAHYDRFGLEHLREKLAQLKYPEDDNV